METRTQSGANSEPKSGATASQVKEISAAADDKLMVMHTELTTNLNSGLTRSGRRLER